MITPAQLREFYRQACLAELQAFKPGNVSVYADGHNMTVADFEISAAVSAEPLCEPAYSLGERIFYAVQATRAAVACNTNLGIILLAAPLIQAVYDYPNLPLRQALHEILTTTSISDADWVFKAIRLASPGGLGDADAQDVHETATVTLTEAMGLASSKDRLALQYLTDYQDIFDFCCLTYYNAVDMWASGDWAMTAVYAGLLSQFPDSHIERKYGDKFSAMVANRMATVYEALLKTDNPQHLMPLLYAVDREFKLLNLNPGTTADMTVATVLIVFLLRAGEQTVSQQIC